MVRRLLIALAIVAAALLLYRSAYVVNQDSIVARTRFGAFVAVESAPGLHFKSPLDELHVLDRRLLTGSYAGESFLTSDQRALQVDFYFKWRVSDAQRYFERAGGDEEIADARLADAVRARIKAAVAKMTFVAALGNWQGVFDEAALADARGTASALGVEFVDVQLEKIGLTDDLAQAVYQRMQQNLAQQAQQLRATGLSEADQIATNAKQQSADILASATRDAQRLRAEADLHASATYARSYGRNPEFAAFYRSLRAYKNTLGRDGDILVVSPDGEFFKYLHSAAGR